MSHHLMIALTLAGVLTAAMSTAYAEGDEEKKPEQPQLIVAEDDKKDTPKPELVAKGEDKWDLKAVLPQSVPA